MQHQAGSTTSSALGHFDFGIVIVFGTGIIDIKQINYPKIILSQSTRNKATSLGHDQKTPPSKELQSSQRRIQKSRVLVDFKKGFLQRIDRIASISRET